MYIGTASASRLYGSPLGVMTAAKITMITDAYRRKLEQRPGVTTPASCRNTSSTGNRKPMPNATIIRTTKLM